MKDRNLVILITIALLVSIAASAYIIYKRVNSEAANNSVELAADFSDIERLSAVQNISAERLLSRLRDSGISAAALTEDIAGSIDLNFIAGVDSKKIDLYVPGKGLSAKKIALIRSSGLRVIPRIRNAFDLDSAVIGKKIRDISSFGTVIFAEEEVLGYPNYIRETARALRSANMKYGFVEFGKQSGDSALASYMGVGLVKVHSIPPEELEKMTAEEAVRRFVRAARERGVRILYVHLFQYPDSGKDILTTNASFILRLKGELSRDGFAIGKASAPQKITVSKPEKALIGLGIAGGALLLLHYFTAVNLYISLAALVLFALLSAKLLALLSAVIFPAYAVISLFPAKREPFNLGIISKSISIVMYVAAVSLVGAVFISALLADRVHMIGIDAFSGVKIALVAPLLIVASYFFLRKENEEKLDVKVSMDKARGLLNTDIKGYHAVLFLLAAACGALFILRSGNFGLPVPGLEKFARGLLENLLVIRPRTKEFLIGYPALILGAIYYLKGGNKWLWFWLSIGVLAPVSMVNSFCHIHTPFMISLVRSVVGLILGIALGFLVYLLYVIWDRNRSKIEELLK